jgi:hypothetical protein
MELRPDHEDLVNTIAVLVQRTRPPIVEAQLHPMDNLRALIFCPARLVHRRTVFILA